MHIKRWHGAYTSKNLSQKRSEIYLQLTLKLLFVILLTGSFGRADGQIFVPYTSIGLGVGTSSYYGDLAPISSFLTSTGRNLRWNVSADVSRHFTKRLDGTLGISWIRLGADDINASDIESYARNLHFRNDLKEISLSARYYPLNAEPNFHKRDNILPYITAGIAYYWHNPKAKAPAEFGGQWVDLQPLHTEGQDLNPLYPQSYALNGVAIPLGLGLKIRYKKRIDISFELVYRITFTDYLDDVSQNYPNPLFLDHNNLIPKELQDLAVAMSKRVGEKNGARTGADRTAMLQKLLALEGKDPFTSIKLQTHGAIGSPRGTDKGNDSYMTATIKIRYLIPDRIKCPKIR